ncbi:MAG: delta-60 repeat domain-containing protein [Bacteroidetes bacterium]|nr:delta-60 repeat domain-containing protein [Bacteroidota bacterium]
MLAGDISDYNGTLTENILRLNSNGSLDTTFDPQNGPNSTVYSSTILPSGKIIISGAFTQFNGTNTGTIARLLSDGSWIPHLLPVHPQMELFSPMPFSQMVNYSLVVVSLL